MLRINFFLLVFLHLIFLSRVQSFADTFVVTNLNDPGAGSLRQAINDSNLTPGPDEIVFQEGLAGTIFLNLGEFSISDDLAINGPGPNNITIDADNSSRIFNIDDGNNGNDIAVSISGLGLINGSQIFGNGICGGGAILNTEVLAVDTCLFEGNSSDDFGGAINNVEGTILEITNSSFTENSANDFGGAINNFQGTILEISNSTFTENNTSDSGSAISNESLIESITNSTFSKNTADLDGGAIFNTGTIEGITNCTFNGNSAINGGAIWNEGLINISFTTISGNQSLNASGGILTVPLGEYRIRNSIIAFNSPNNCSGPVDDLFGNWSNDSSCNFLGDNSNIVLLPLADNGGPTETMELVGGDPGNGATDNCDALDENGNPTGIPIGVDQRYFPRPFGPGCDSGAFEPGPESFVTITKATDPSGGNDFRFGSSGFNPLQDCPLDGGGDGMFSLNDGESITCRVPEGEYSIHENVPNGYRLAIICFEVTHDLVIDDKKGEITFSVSEFDSSDIDCLFTNVRIKDGGGSCSLAPVGANSSIPLYLFIPALLLISRIAKRFRK